MSKGFVSTMRKGFQMTFENGLTASVQWGAGNYCDNHLPADFDFSFSKDASSDTAEIAVWDQFGEWLDPQDFLEEATNSDGMVAGYLTPAQVVKFLSAVEAYPNQK